MEAIIEIIGGIAKLGFALTILVACWVVPIAAILGVIAISTADKKDTTHD